MKKMLASLIVAVLAGCTFGLAQEKTGHSCHSDARTLDERGDDVMGFDHAKTTHHFVLSKAGGSIEVSAKGPEDAESRDAIRMHLSHVARMFADGNFEAPMLIHDRVPPGVPTMKRKKSVIEWKFEELPAGGRVRITTKDAEALAAIHEFLRFQIEDHRTGDPTNVTR